MPVLPDQHDLVVSGDAHRTHPVDAIDQVILLDVDAARRAHVLLAHPEPRPLDDGLGAEDTPWFHAGMRAAFTLYV